MRRVRFAGGPEPVQPPITHDAWGSDDDEEQQEQQQAAGHAAGQPKHARQQQPQQRLSAPILYQIQHSKLQPAGTTVVGSTATGKQEPVPDLLQQQLEATSKERRLPSLHQLCLGVLGRHVTDLVEQLDGQLGWLPADVKAALLAVARRRGELTGAVLSALADAEWTQLDLAGCRRLLAAELLTVAHCMANVRVLDVTGFEHLIAGGWKQLALAWPNLAILRMGGTEAASREALKALPHILPGLAAPTAAAAAAAVNQSCAGSIGRSTSGNSAAHAAGLDSWEDALESDNEEDSSAHMDHSSSKPGGLPQQQPQHYSTAQASSRLPAASPKMAADCRLKQLRVLVWPDVPQEAVELVQQRCPRVVINPVIKPDVVTGELPPAEVDPSVPLDQPFMELVGPDALQDISQDSALRQPGMPIVHIADKFRAAYIQQAARLRDKERRLRKAEQRKQLKSSHALRTLNAWLDEPA